MLPDVSPLAVSVEDEISTASSSKKTMSPATMSVASPGSITVMI